MYTRECTGNSVPATGTHFIYKPFTTAGSQKYQASGLFTIQSLAEQRLLGRKHHTVPSQALVLVQSAQSIGKRYMVLACAFSKQRRKRVSLEQDIQFYRNRRHTPIRHTRSQCFLSNIPQTYPRIYCFLNDNLEKARRKVRSHPEFENMITDRAMRSAQTMPTIPNHTDKSPVWRSNVII